MQKSSIIWLILLLLVPILVYFIFYGDEISSMDSGFYDINYEDPEWKEFETSAEMRAAIYIPEEDLVDLPTDEVLIAVLEYPLIGDLFVFNDIETAVRCVSEHCTALRIFLSREDAEQVLDDALLNMESVSEKMHSPDLDKEGIKYILPVLKLYFDLLDMPPIPDGGGYVKAPDGTDVYVRIDHDLLIVYWDYYNSSL